jgi:serine/threonine protein kinase
MNKDVEDSEIGLLLELEHSNIIKIFEVYKYEDLFYYIVLEYC